MHAMARSIIMTYPGFRELPRGLKMLLLESETFFFGEVSSKVRQEPHAVPNPWQLHSNKVAPPRIVAPNHVQKN